MAAIEGIALSKSFGGVVALRSASFAADGGEVHALVGENGAGKSTLIKLLSGLYPPDSGEIQVDGKAVTFGRPQEALAAGIGTVFQELTLLPYMTVAENVMLGREPLNGPFIQKSRLVERAHELFAAAGIGAQAAIEPLELVGNLSLAQQQIVEIVKAVSRRPRIVFMDEPTSALAEHSVLWLFGLIKRLRDDGACIVFTSHRWNEIKGIADRGTVFQELTLLPYMTVAENVMLGREPLNGPFIQKSRLVERAHELFAAAGIGAEAAIEPLELVGNLSLAQQQIVEIVKAVSRRPRIVFMDEPTSALAEHSVLWLFGLIKRLRDEGACIVFTSHRWNEIKGIADRITVFRNGEWVATSKAVDLSEDAAVERMTGQRLDVLFPKPTPLVSQNQSLAVTALCAKGLPEISFEARTGEVLGIGGLAGQGQRELFLTLFGVNARAGGTVRVDGRETRIRSPHDAIRAGIALIPEDRKTEGLLLPLSVRQNLALAVLERLSRGGFVRRAAEDELVGSMVTSLAIKTPTPGQRVGALSGGNQQKVLIGRWLLTDARVLLLYDITRGVDVATKRDIYVLIRRLSEEGRTILLYSTDTEEIAHLCHRVLIMREGRVVSELRDTLTPEAIVAAAIRVPVAS